MYIHLYFYATLILSRYTIFHMHIHLYSSIIYNLFRRIYIRLLIVLFMVRIGGGEELGGRGGVL